jgi:hypothetical protein
MKATIPHKKIEKSFSGQKVLCGELKSFCRMQNLVKASTSLNSAHQEQLIAPCLGANGPRGRTFQLKSEQYLKTC